MPLLRHSKHHHILGSFAQLTPKEFYLEYNSGVSFSSAPQPVIGILACSYLQFLLLVPLIYKKTFLRVIDLFFLEGGWAGFLGYTAWVSYFFGT